MRESLQSRNDVVDCAAHLKHTNTHTGLLLLPADEIVFHL